MTWEIDGFALATGYDESTGRFDGLAIPHQDSFDLITDAVLLVEPAAAQRQRREESFSRSRLVAPLGELPAPGGADLPLVVLMGLRGQVRVGDLPYSVSHGVHAD